MRLLPADAVGVVQDGAGAVPGAGHEVAVDLVTSMLLCPSQRETSVIGMPHSPRLRGVGRGADGAVQGEGRR